MYLVTGNYIVVNVTYKRAIQLSLQEVRVVIVLFVAYFQSLLDQTTW